MMKLSKKMEVAINEQINAEFYSAYLYFSMALYFEGSDLKGFAKWMHAQAHEEWAHGKRLVDLMLERGSSPSLKAIAKPTASWRSPLSVFMDSYKHEQKVTAMINKLYGLAKKENDHATEIALQWFISEQVEEEASVSEIVERLKLAGDKGHALLIVDKELAMRERH
jgi:ferritin